MKGYLLDSNICIFALRGEHGIDERMLQFDRIEGIEIENWVKRP